MAVNRWGAYVARRLDEIATHSPVLPGTKALINKWLPSDCVSPNVIPEDGGVILVWHYGGYTVEIGITPCPYLWAYQRERGESVWIERTPTKQEVRAAIDLMYGR